MSEREVVTLAFQRVFGTVDSNRSPEQLIVLARLRDLAKPNQSQFSPIEDDRTLAMRQGRLELWFEIDSRLSGKPDTLREVLGRMAVPEDDSNDN